MNLEKEILQANFREQAVALAQHIISDKNLFAELMKLYFSHEPRICQRAAWIVSHCAEHDNSLLVPYIKPMIKNLYKNVGDATKRNTVRVLRFLDIPEELWGEIIEICFRYLKGNEAIAIKVFSMTILYNLSHEIPEIIPELKISIEDQLPYGSPGFKSRGNKILAKLA